VVNGIKSWLQGWSSNNWITSTKKEIKNLELWKEIYNIQKEKGKIDIRWIKGHSDPTKAESTLMYYVLTIQAKVDELARAAINMPD
jgi:ribonuclease HI